MLIYELEEIKQINENSTSIIKYDGTNTPFLYRYLLKINRINMRFSLKVKNEDIPILILGQDWLSYVRATNIKSNKIFKI
ncbi:7684_t:CDS:2 [Funneliformis caledonium]|uniref:7684_t:CDS:1 n=1 Tax=Funneliformis caledonium TaxID=1117310 RepID=A0A9N9F150_9GLOM|nr:7684_t:CDS:2 [Funneliformis caledonium]